MFKYYILNRVKFYDVGFTFTNDKDTTENDKYIAQIGLELAFFFNKQAKKEIKEINANDTFYFLTNKQYNNIYINFLKTIITNETIKDKTDDNGDVLLNTELTPDDKKLIE